MHQCLVWIVIVESVVDPAAGDSDGVSDVAARQSFSKDENIRQYLVRYKPVSGPPKSSGYFIENQQYAILVAKFSGSF